MKFKVYKLIIFNIVIIRRDFRNNLILCIILIGESIYLEKNMFFLLEMRKEEYNKYIVIV